MMFGTLKQLFVKTFLFQEKRRTEMCRVEFVKSKHVTVVPAFSSLLASVIIFLKTRVQFAPKAVHSLGKTRQETKT